MNWDTLEKKAWFSLGLCWNGLTRHALSEWIIWHASSDDSHTQRFRFWKAFDTEILAANVSSWWLVPLSADLQQLSATWLQYFMENDRQLLPSIFPAMSQLCPEIPNSAHKAARGQLAGRSTEKCPPPERWLPTYHDDHENQEALNKFISNHEPSLCSIKIYLSI